MSFTILLIFRWSPTRLWAGVVILFIAGLGYLINKLTRGYTTGYLHSQLSDSTKNKLKFIHGFCSFLFSLILPNNFLNRISFFKNLYQENELWIAASIFILLISSLAVLGATFTLIARRWSLENAKNKEVE